mmetsp:Transcript_92219/g.231951  ORF Transcript_92219/g.231951 Transcript_92219/m.231951 type:complete len:155 (+) Transcript_92219:748-1212(+)
MWVCEVKAHGEHRDWWYRHQHLVRWYLELEVTGRTPRRYVDSCRRGAVVSSSDRTLATCDASASSCGSDRHSAGWEETHRHSAGTEPTKDCGGQRPWRAQGSAFPGKPEALALCGQWELDARIAPEGTSPSIFGTERWGCGSAREIAGQGQPTW